MAQQELTRAQVDAMAMNARNGYRISNPGSCDSNRHAACVDVQVLAASYESLRQRCEELERERDGLLAMQPFDMPHEAVGFSTKQYLEKLTSQLAAITARAEGAEHQNERLELALRYLAELGGGNSEGNY